MGMSVVRYLWKMSPAAAGALPAVLLVLVFQKYMVQGLTAGSVKG
jgi:ABC-type maltose transport system permease subunit